MPGHDRAATTAGRAGRVPWVTPTNRPLSRPCPPSRPRGPACSRRLVGLLTPRLCRLHAFSRADVRRNGSKQPASTPGHSGGAVPESHRSSLFAGRGKPPAGPATRVGAKCSGCGGAVNDSGTRRTNGPSCQPWPLRCETLRVAWRPRVKPCGWCGVAPQPLRTCAARQSRPDAHMRNTAEKKRCGRSSRLRRAADSPFRPRGITVPVGQPGGGSNLLFRVTDWLDRPAAERFVNHNLGMTSFANETDTLVWFTSKGDVAR
jgi:hypothetical protein